MTEPIPATDLVRLALDAASGDFGADVTVGAARDALRSDPRIEMVLIGLPGQLDQAHQGLERE